MEMEEYARAIDFLPEGRSNEREREPTAQLLGEKYFTLLEVAVKKGVNCSLGRGSTSARTSARKWRR